jgi:hypothetical protein
MTAVLRQVALVSEAPSLEFNELARTSAAIQKQVTRDLGPIWDVEATVDAFPELEDVPPGYWPVIIVDDDPRLADSPIGGVHLDRDNQPFSVLKRTDHWGLIASHEVLEMLVDPFGNRLIAGNSPKGDQGRVEFLVEVCDPSETSSYMVNGLPVADFYTPHYFDPVASAGVRYSFTGAITEPRQILRGGYLSWHCSVHDEWWQATFFGDHPEFRNLGSLTELGASLRSQIDGKTDKHSSQAIAKAQRLIGKTASDLFHATIRRPSECKARAWRAHIDRLKNQPFSEPPPTEPSNSAQKRRPRRTGRSTK